MRLARKLLLGAATLLIVSDALLLISGRKLLVYVYDEQMVTHEGDLILPATPERRGPGYSAPYLLTTCVYWTGFKVSRMLMVDAGRCAWLSEQAQNDGQKNDRLTFL